MSEVIINSKEFFPLVPAQPYVPAIEPCEEYPEGVPAQEATIEYPAHWNVDAIVDTPSGTRTGVQYVELGEDATDEDITNYLLALYPRPAE